MPTYAKPEDVLARWGKSVEDQDEEILALINVRLGDVERMLKRRFKRAGRDLAAELAADAIDVDDIVQVEADAVLRLARNPEGYQSETDGSYNYMFRQDLATGTLDILDSEWDILGFTTSGIFIIEANPVMPV